MIEYCYCVFSKREILMKNKILLLMVSLSVIACTPMAQLYTDTTDQLGLTPAYARTVESVATENRFSPPAGTPDGAFSIQSRVAMVEP